MPYYNLMMNFIFRGGIIFFLTVTFVMSCNSDTALVQFDDPEVVVNEFGKPQTITVSFSSPVYTDGILQIGIRDSTASYGTEYTTLPDGSSKTIDISVRKGVTSASFTVLPVQRSSSDGDKVVNFTISGLGKFMKLGLQKKIRTTIIDDDLVCYLPMNGNARDMSHIASTTLVQGATLTMGRFLPNTAYQMDGVDDGIMIANSEALDTIRRITMTAWIKPVSFNFGNSSIVEKPFSSHSEPYYQYKLGITGDRWPNLPGSFLFTLSISRSYLRLSSNEGTWIPGLWYFVAGTYDGSKMTLYINGNEASSAGVLTFNGKIDSWGKDIYVGKMANLKNSTPGTFGEVRIYNRDLSAEEIKALYLR